MRLLRAAGLAVIGLLPTFGQTDWPVNGGIDNIRYTRLEQITPQNVGRLQVAWSYDTGDASKESEMQSNPVVVDGVLYFASPSERIIALDAATGKQRWSFNPEPEAKTKQHYRLRGVTLCKTRVFFTFKNFLYALNKDTGRPVAAFGDNGRIDLRKDLGRDIEGVTISATSPGAIFDPGGDEHALIILGSTVSETLPGSPGHLRAFDTEKGELRWIFHTIPWPGEFGYETWPPDAYKINGGANAWGGVTVDTKNGLLFAATGSASFDFYGSNRHGDDLFANCLLALDARTGKRIWHFQSVRHDMWDMDFPAAPSLVTVTRDGKKVEAVAQITKTGFTFVFERKTGQSLFPIEYRKVPASPVDGEEAAEKQPYPVAPPPYARQLLTEDMLTKRTPEAHADAVARFRKLNSHGLFTPPSTEGTIIFPGFDGGGEWGGAAFDPETGLLYVNSNEAAWILRLVPRDDTSLYKSNCAGCHGDDRKGSPPMFPSLVNVGTRRTRAEIVQTIQHGAGLMPNFSSLGEPAIRQLASFLVTGVDHAAAAQHDPNWQKYRSDGYNRFLDSDGYPAIEPPWGTLNAIDLNAGEIRWKIPFGEYPKLAAQGMRNTGSDNYGGPVVTANGLLFIGATNFDRKFRAFDKLTGKLLWETTLPAAGNATPSVYAVKGREYVVIACGGGKGGTPSGGRIVAFALPGHLDGIR